MSLPAFTATAKLADNSKTQTQTIVRAFNQLTTNLQQIFTGSKVQNDSVLLQGIVLAAGKPTIFPHTLGRQLTGWQVVRLDAPALVYDTAADKQNLTLVSSVAATVSLLVF